MLEMAQPNPRRNNFFADAGLAGKNAGGGS
jgi:hypothetical protein